MSELGERFIYRGRPMTLRVLVRMVHRMFGQHGPLVVTVQPADKQRTDRQNNYMWSIIRQIGRHLGSDDEELTKKHLLTMCYGPRHKTIDGVEYEVPIRTSKMTPKQFAQMLDWMLMYATENGIPMIPPEGYAQWAIEARNGAS